MSFSKNPLSHIRTSSDTKHINNIIYNKVSHTLPNVKLQLITSPSKTLNKLKDPSDDIYDGFKINSPGRIKPKSPTFEYRKSIRTGNELFRNFRQGQGQCATTRATPYEQEKGELNPKLKLWDALIDLKLLTEKYEKNPDILVPIKTDLIKVIQTLSLLTNVNSPLNDHMKIVLNILNMALYFNPKILKLYDDFIQSSENPEMKIIGEVNSETKLPYYSVLHIFIHEILESKKLLKSMMNEHKIITKALQDKINEQDSVIMSYVMKYGKRDELSEEYIQDVLKNEIDNLKNDLNKLTVENKKLDSMLKESNKINSELKEQIASQKLMIQERNFTIESLLSEKTKMSDQLNEIKANYMQLSESRQNIKDILDKLILKLSNLKNEINILKRENEDLQFEKEKLALRAAAGFENLTPRPDYDAILKEKNIELLAGFYKGTKRNKNIKISTTQFFEAILQKYTEILHKSRPFEKKINSVRPVSPENKTSNAARDRWKRSKTIIMQEVRKNNSKAKENVDSQSQPYILEISAPEKEKNYGAVAKEKSDILLSEIIETKKLIEK